MQSVVSDLNKYRDFKSAIQALTKNLDELRKEATYLASQHQNLQQDNLKIFSSCIHTGCTVNFLQGAVFSLRNEFMNLIALYIFITRSLLEYPLDDRDKLQSAHQFNEFAALSRSKRGEKEVPIEEIKKDVIKAIEVLLNRIGPNDDKLAAHLFVAYNAIIE